MKKVFVAKEKEDVIVRGHPPEGEREKCPTLNMQRAEEDTGGKVE